MEKISIGGVDITGQRFGRLVAIKSLYTIKKHLYWLFRCDCGVEKPIGKGRVVKGGCKSCGCYSKELFLKRSVIHGMTRTPEYIAWAGIVACTANKNNPAASRYVGRGITMCDSWRNSFEEFYKDMGAKPSPKHSIDRINNNGNYEPSNCRWATYTEQNNNRRDNIHITIKGETKTPIQWSIIVGISSGVILKRLRNGWSPEHAVMEKNHRM